MPGKIFIDTSGFFAFLNKSDENHEEAKKRLSTAVVKMTSNYVFDELMTLLTARGQKALSITFGEQLRAGTMTGYHFLTASEEEKAWEIYQKFRDHPLSFTDCTTLALLREHRASGLVSFDATLLKVAGHFEKE